jgi:hypothetical protein
MGFDFRMPNIVGNEREQLQAIRSYLYQFIPQLQWALNTIDTTGASGNVAPTTSQIVTASSAPFDSEVAFGALKPLIIKSAEIVEAYYEEISERLVSKYVAQSDFCTFIEENGQVISKSATDIEQIFSNMQTIITDIKDLNFTLAKTNATIKSGVVDEDAAGLPVYGIEIRQKNTTDGEEYHKFARFTSDRLSFYDQSETEVAHISGYKLYITYAEVTGVLTLGRYEIDTTNGLAFNWV